MGSPRQSLVGSCEGRQSRRWVEQARSSVANAVGAEPRNVVFTSGGTEANALALAPGLRRLPAFRSKGSWSRPSSTLSVLAGGRFPIQAMATIGVTSSGLLDLDHLRAGSRAGLRRWCR